MQTHTLRADVRANRARLLEAALTVLRERGTDAEVKEIIERAGVGNGTFYRHFGTKDALVAAIVAEMCEAVDQMLDEATALDDAVAAITHLIHRVVGISEKYGDVLERLRAGPPFPEDQGSRLDPLVRMAAIVQRGIDRGQFRPELNAEVAVTAMIGGLLPGPYGWLRSLHAREEIEGQILQMFLRGATNR